MKLSYFPFPLHFKYPFKIAHGLRTHTPCLFVKIELDGKSGYGECTLPPYLVDTIKSSIEFLDNINLLNYTSLDINPSLISDELDKAFIGNYSIKAAINMALWDLKGKIENKLVSNYFLPQDTIPYCTYTIGISNEQEIKEKIAASANFELYKLKLDGINDIHLIETFVKNSSKPFAVDANQSWKNIDDAIEILRLLEKYSCFLIEQPFDKKDRVLSKKLKKTTHIPIIADEAFQHIDELDELADSFDGVNIKLMKCGGISNANKIIEKAKMLHLKILLGCMSESACGCASATMLQHKADWVDLDGPYLIDNNPFEGFEVNKGYIKIAGLNGIGVHTNLF